MSETKAEAPKSPHIMFQSLFKDLLSAKARNDLGRTAHGAAVVMIIEAWFFSREMPVAIHMQLLKSAVALLELLFTRSRDTGIAALHSAAERLADDKVIEHFAREALQIGLVQNNQVQRALAVYLVESYVTVQVNEPAAAGDAGAAKREAEAKQHAPEASELPLSDAKGAS